MDTRFTPHNLHWLEPKRFAELDPHLQMLINQPYVYHAPLIDEIPRDIPGIYTVGGGRQIGKSTLLKQWMLSLMNDGVNPNSIAWFTGELIDDHHTLTRLMISQLEEMPATPLKYFIIDEVTYISGWDRAVKYLADAGYLRDVELVLTGSDLIIMQEARMRFPGRRGKADKVNFHVYPLSFKELLCLTNRLSSDIETYYTALNEYLIHGGYLTAINEYARDKNISIATLQTYSEWIRGDVMKRDRQEHYLREIIGAILKRYNSQVSWINLAQDLSIDHPKTVADYIAILESMDAVYVQHALLEDKLVAAPKKHKKLMFTDPFIFHALSAWVNPVPDPFNQQILPTINDPTASSKIVEAVVVTHYRRTYPTYYIKAEGEVDIAYVDKQQFWPIEVKWTKQLRSKDLKQICKYTNAKILAKVFEETTTMGLPTLPLPLALAKMA